MYQICRVCHWVGSWVGALQVENELRVVAEPLTGTGGWILAGLIITENVWKQTVLEGALPHARNPLEMQTQTPCCTSAEPGHVKCDSGFTIPICGCTNPVILSCAQLGCCLTLWGSNKIYKGVAYLWVSWASLSVLKHINTTFAICGILWVHLKNFI